MNAMAVSSRDDLVLVKDRVAGVKPGRSAPLAWSGLDWHVAAARGPHAEAEAFLQQAGCIAFSPAFWVAHRRGGRGPWLETLDRPMGGYVFVCGLEAAFTGMARRRQQGLAVPVAGFLGALGRPARVNGMAMQALFALNERGSEWRMQCPSAFDPRLRMIRPGTKVRVATGAFSEVDAVVTAVLAGDRVEIMAQLFGREHVSKVALDRLVEIG